MPRERDAASDSYALNLLLACIVVLLVLLEARVVPGLSHGWAFNLWQYHPPALFGVGALCAGLLCVPVLRRLGLTAVTSLAQRALRLPRPVFEAGAIAAFLLLLTLFRERQLYGDSFLLFNAALVEWSFVFPEVGATAAMRVAVITSKLVGVRPMYGIQAMVIASGGLCLWLCFRLGPYLDPRARGLALALLFATGGMARIFAGRIEVYALLLAGVLLYLWLALAHLQGRAPLWRVALAAGFAVWAHAAAICLLPSLALLAWWRRDTFPERLRELIFVGLLSAVPLLVFLALSLATGSQADLDRAFAKALEVLGQSEAADRTRWWMRMPWEGESIGSDYVLLSWGHLKHHTNALHLLVPFALPGLVYGLGWKRAILRERSSSFLAACCVPGLAYLLLLRPFWGPYDWDLFAMPALCLLALAIHLVFSQMRKQAAIALIVLVVALQTLFVGLPFLALRMETARDAGPFAEGWFDWSLREAGSPPPERLAPWL